MIDRPRFRRSAVLAALALAAAAALVPAGKVRADEGMWTFDNPPVKRLQDRYGFTPSADWLNHLRLASVRFMDGGSGSFISPDGLILTNHHVAMGQLQKISTADHDYVATGFYARTPADEIPSPDLEVNVLMSTEDVTDRVQSAVRPDMGDAQALLARRAAIAAIEKASLDATGLRSNVIDLYHGGQYWLYRYKKYTDVRLVMAPERQAAFYGGDDDNFTYPRWDLDMAYFRAYENGKPVRPSHFLQWNPKGLRPGDLVFVSGNPGSTDRLFTMAQLEFQRDVAYPLRLGYIDRYLKTMRDYSAQGPEQARRALGMIFGLSNSQKALQGEYKGLEDPKIMAKKAQEESDFRRLVAGNPQWNSAYGEAWDAVAKVMAVQRDRAKPLFYHRILGTLPSIAQTLVFYATEIAKPDAQRLPGFHDAELSELRFNLLSPAPVYKDMDETVMAAGLSWSLQELGTGDAFVKTALDGSTPDAVAKRDIEGTGLQDVAARKALLDGGARAVQASDDPLIVLMRALEPILRDDERWARENVQSPLSSATEKIARARFAAFGTSTYPDATFTLRLAYGAAVGYPMNGTIAPYMTTLYGLYDRALSFGDTGEFALPKRFWDRRASLDLATPVNFVSSADIIGGNSGSPVVNRAGELVGLIFDGNIESLVGRFVYDETTNRAVAVHSAYMLEGLRKLYDAGPLADEIMRGSGGVVGKITGSDASPHHP